MGPDSWAGRMWICGVFVSDRGSWRRSVGLQHGTWGLRRWMTGCSTIGIHT